MMRYVIAFLFSLFLCTQALAKPATQLSQDLTLAEAQIVLKAALDKATAQGVPMNIAVVDAGGNLKAFLRQDGAFLGSIDISQKKAITARFFNMSSADLGAPPNLVKNCTELK